MTASLRFKKLDLQKKLQEESGTNWHRLGCALTLPRKSLIMKTGVIVR